MKVPNIDILSLNDSPSMRKPKQIDIYSADSVSSLDGHGSLLDQSLPKP